MRIDGTHLFDAPREEVWDLVRDPGTVRRLVPGIERLEEISDREYRGEMRVGKGWIKATYEVSIRIVEEAPPERLVLDVDGSGSLGDAGGSLEVELSETEPGRTRMRYDVRIELGGRASSMAGMLEGVARQRASRGLFELDRVLEERRS